MEVRGGAEAPVRHEVPQFPLATQPDLVMAAEKDVFYRRELRSALSGAAEAVLRPHQSVALVPELRFLAELIYFGAGPLTGRQTLGEEFCDVFPVVAVQNGERMELPRVANRLTLVFFAVVCPYMARRIENGGWKSLKVLFKKPQSAAERAAEMRRKMLERTQRMQNEEITVEGVKRREESYFLWITSKRAVLLRVLGWSSFLYRLHLATFYLRGTFFDIPRRLAGMRMATPRELKGNRPSYAFLGWLLLAQLGVEIAPKIRQGVASLLLSRGFLRSSTSKTKTASSEEDQVPSAIVPSLQTVEELEDVTIDDVIIKDDQHQRGMEDIKCGICLSSVENGACPPCGHMFCFQHVMEAVASKGACPICRRESEPQDVMCIYYTL